MGKEVIALSPPYPTNDLEVHAVRPDEADVAQLKRLQQRRQCTISTLLRALLRTAKAQTMYEETTVAMT